MSCLPLWRCTAFVGHACCTALHCKALDGTAPPLPPFWFLKGVLGLKNPTKSEVSLQGGYPLALVPAAESLFSWLPERAAEHVEVLNIRILDGDVG